MFVFRYHIEPKKKAFIAQVIVNLGNYFEVGDFVAIWSYDIIIIIIMYVSYTAL